MSITSTGLSDHELGTALETNTSVAGYKLGAALNRARASRSGWTGAAGPSSDT